MFNLPISDLETAERFIPSRHDRKEVKRKAIAFLSESGACGPSELKQLRRMHLDDVLSAFFQRCDVLTMTLRDGRRIYIRPRETHPAPGVLQ